MHNSMIDPSQASSLTFSQIFSLLVIGAFVGGSIIHAYHIGFFDNFHFFFLKKREIPEDRVEAEVTRSRFKAAVACAILFLVIAGSWKAFAS